MSVQKTSERTVLRVRMPVERETDEAKSCGDAIDVEEPMKNACRGHNERGDFGECGDRSLPASWRLSGRGSSRCNRHRRRVRLRMRRCWASGGKEPRGGDGGDRS